MAVLENKYCTKLVDSLNLLETNLKLFDDMDTLLSSNKHLLLEIRLSSAGAFGTTEGEKNKDKYNARNQIPLCGPKGELHERKQTAGRTYEKLL